MVGIYKITNSITGQVYIGQSVSIEERWNTHKRLSQLPNENNKLYQSIKEYGLNNFVFEVIEECPTEELNEKEIYWIDFYNSVKMGLNTAPGGSCGPWYEFEKIREAWDEGKTVKEIAEDFKVSENTVRRYLINYSNYNSSESHRRIDNSDMVYKGIYQYGVDGKFIKSWDGISEAAKELNIWDTAIGCVLRGERATAGGFQWSAIKVLEMPNIGRPKSASVRVEQYTLDNKLLNTYNSFSEASRAVNGDVSFIRRVSKDESKTAYGFRWKRLDD